MSMDCVFSVVTKIGEYLVAPICRELGYLIHYKSNIENLRNQVQKLEDKRHGVQGSVDAANRNGEIIKADVEKWLTSVNGITSEVDTFLGDDVKFNKRCFSGQCPNWSSRYSLSKEAKKKSLILNELREDGKFDSVSFPAPPLGIESIPEGDFVAFESTKSAMKEIMEALKDVNISIIGLYGMGGVGKTTLVTKVGKQAKEDKLFDEVVMAVASQTQNLRNIQGQIADKLGLKLDAETEPGRADRLRSRFKNEKRILLILDDVWEKLNLEALGILLGDDHKIVLTTRRQEVCHKMGIQTKTIQLNVLSEIDSWNLFRKYAGQAVDSPPLNVVAREVAKHCGGLPIALVTVGSALGDEELKEWEKVALKLKEFKPMDNEDADQDVFSCMKLSYDYVKGEETKSCLLLCSLFPEDHDIHIEILARYGMGQGLFQNIETVEEARGRAHTAIKNLKGSCLLLDGNKEGFVKMHDVVRHATISIASKDKDMWVRSGVGLNEWPNKQTFKDDKVISLMYNRIKKLPDGLECPKLETLLLQGNFLPSVQEGFFKEMEALKVLDISGPRYLKFDLPASIGSLKNLRTLHLNDCWIRDISILGELKKLEILSFYGSWIKELPKEIGQLSKLRLLDLRRCGIEIIRPNVISSLSKLEELYMGGSFRDWEDERTGDRSNASLAELKSLGCLTILSMKIPNVNCLPKDLRLPKLIRFSISIGYAKDFAYYPTSKTMYLIDIEIPSTDEIEGLLAETEELYLQELGDLPNILSDISRDGLNCLKSLNVINCENIQYLTNAIEGSQRIAFCRLEKLHLRYLSSLRELCHGLQLPARSFQNLRVMVVDGCNMLLNVVSANLLQRLQNLEELQIKNCQELKNIFNIEGKGPGLATSLLKLKKLKISKCSSLEGIELKHEEKVEEKDSSSNVVLSFPSLNTIKVERCPVLRYLFSSSTLTPGSLPQLRELSIRRCSKLKNIFSPSTARCLFQLEILLIEHCDIMEEAVSTENNNEGEEAVNKLVFPKLKTIKLFHLHKLKSFCSGNFSFECPSLEQVLVSNCPKMETFIAAAALGIPSTPNLKKITLDGEEILPMGDLNTIIQNWFKGKGKASWINKDESTSKLKFWEVDNETRVHDGDDESTSESEVEEIDNET